MHAAQRATQVPCAAPADVRALHNLERLNPQSTLVALIGHGPNERSLVALEPNATYLTAQTLRQALQTPSLHPRVFLASYELGYAFVGLPVPHPPPGQPLGLMLDCTASLVFDPHAPKATCTGTPAQQELLQRALAAPTQQIPQHASLTPDVSDATHQERIRQAQRHIAQGDIYQANITRRLSVSGLTHGPSALAALSQHNPVSRGAYLKHHNFELVSNSMETLLSFDPTTRLAQSFPIKGTRARHTEPDQDQAARLALAQDPKERAEHVMIVDLVRNDLGKVCVPGTVRVPTLWTQEPYKRVWHGVSTVEGVLSPTHNVADLVASLFPGGSITGAPKRRAMQVIQDIEQTPRGAYTGSLGVLWPDGSLTLSILIRTLVKDERGWGLSVGGGIVEGSHPQREVDETWAKVAVFGEALGPTDPRLHRRE